MVRRGDVRRAKLYYLRDLRGKAAKIKERRGANNEFIVEEVIAPEVMAPEVMAPEVMAPEVVAPEVIAPEVIEAAGDSPVVEEEVVTEPETPAEQA